MTSAHVNLWRTWGGPLATAFGALAVASWLRFGWIENGGLAALCSAQNECLIKTAVVASFTDQRVGWAALLIALVALATRRGALAYVTLALACAGLMLYGAGPAAPALWIAVLLLVGAWPKALR